jgi:glutamine amidotransferase PdxT
MTVGSSPSGLGVLPATAFHPELTPDQRIHEFFVSMVKGTS